EDVDDGLIERFKRLAAAKGRIDESLLQEPKEVLLERLHLKFGEELTNAAMLLFSKDPEKYQVGAYVKVGYFETDSDLRYQDEIHGSLLEIVDRIVEVLHLKYMRAQITYVGMQRRERYIVPDAALREALYNALCHSQYSYGVPIQISVYADKIYIANIGSLPADWTAENLMKKHASRPGNPTIAQVLYYAGFIESWGRGIEKICEACLGDGLPLPEYTVHPNDVMVKFSAPEDRVVLGPRAVGEKAIDAIGERAGAKLTRGEKDVLRLLVEDPAFKYSDIAARIGMAEKTVYKWIKSLKQKGVIKRIGSDRAGRWNVVAAQGAVRGLGESA
ncbi:MAG: winged helix-turn-helix transcriptional regulator, partial [Duodenibacillus sp.]|nr:winged helix-turn-helix transcriptional regulator [Duodenibacillus sp.]